DPPRTVAAIAVADGVHVAQADAVAIAAAALARRPKAEAVAHRVVDRRVEHRALRRLLGVAVWVLSPRRSRRVRIRHAAGHDADPADLACERELLFPAERCVLPLPLHCEATIRRHRTRRARHALFAFVTFAGAASARLLVARSDGLRLRFRLAL